MCNAESDRNSAFKSGCPNSNAEMILARSLFGREQKSTTADFNPLHILFCDLLRFILRYIGFNLL